MDRSALESLLRNQMPVAKAMDVHVLTADKNKMELSCSLSANYNHLGTAFGGSLCTLMILAAYCQLFDLINGQGHVVIKRSEMEFLKPVQEDLRAVCLPPGHEAAQAFLKAYQKKGRARIELISEIVLKDGTVAARMLGEFVSIGG